MTNMMVPRKKEGVETTNQFVVAILMLSMQIIT